MNKNIKSSLLILGNGFDLYCGLKSSFKDFLKTSRKENIWYKIFQFAFSETNVTYSNPIFAQFKKDDVLWMDVEDYIKNILYIHNDVDNKERNRLLRTFGVEDYLSVLKLCYEKRFEQIYLYTNIQFKEMKNYFSRHFNADYKSINIIAFLKQELEKFEEEFRNYIIDISSKEEYQTYSNILLSYLVDSDEMCDVLTFNYTTPSDRSTYNSINHIHGRVEDKIIIGFDSSDITNINDSRLEMSKSFQKLYFKVENMSLPPAQQLRYIKFYGHSLGKQDYSYFHSIFDYYDIYDNSNVSLVFYYTPYNDTDEENERHRIDYISRIVDLLNTYSLKASIHNEKSNVIISRLLLENRLFIKEIKKLSKD